ncbi:MAG: SGNH/GDSL hydrolase family protein [Clostridia bacterium]|nr:SGNH/GDSL hydrolase family protein [Clostridia bacterium]
MIISKTVKRFALLLLCAVLAATVLPIGVFAVGDKEAGGPFYKWNFTDAGVIENVTGNCLTANGIKETVTENQYYTLEKDIVLEADKPWQISFTGSHVTSQFYVPLCSREGMEKDGTTYIFLGGGYGVNVGRYIGASPINYGFSEAALSAYVSGNHTYTIRNEYDGTKYQVILYVDGDRIGAMKSGNNDVDFDFVFGATGTSGVTHAFYSPKGFKNLTVNEARGTTSASEHTLVSGTEKPATCLKEGMSAEVYCSVCGYLQAEAAVLPVGDHSYGADGNCTVCGVNGIVSKLLKGKYISILGDSISSFNGISNGMSYREDIADNAVHYYGGNGVTLDRTYWMQTANRFGLNICVDNAFAGDVVRNGGLTRSDRLHTDAGQKPDIILFYMGINDCGLYKEAPGSVSDYSALKTGSGYKSAANFAEAYAISIEKMKAAYPDAQIFCVTLLPQSYYDVTESLVESYSEAIRTVAAHYGLPVIDFANNSGITWENHLNYMTADKIHPNADGMDLMAKTVIDAVEEFYLESYGNKPVIEGAQYRITGRSGLRFLVNAPMYNNVNNNSTIERMGTLIIPTNKLNGQALTLTENGKIGDISYLDIPAKFWYDTDNESYMKFTAVLLDIPDDNRKFTAVAYIIYKDGTIVYSEPIERSIEDVRPDVYCPKCGYVPKDQIDAPKHCEKCGAELIDNGWSDGWV